jgi:acyl-CoA thioesterase FadM
MARELRGMSAVKQEIDYSSEQLPGNACYIESEINDIGAASLEGGHTLRSDASKQISASCGFTAVHIDRAHRAPAPLPAGIRDRVVSRYSETDVGAHRCRSG